MQKEENGMNDGRPDSTLGPFALISARGRATTTNCHGRLRPIVWLAAIFIGILLSLQYRNEIDPDTVAHLDMADAYFRGDWKMAVNGYWNPLYAWILGLVIHSIGASAYWEYPLVHLVVFTIFLFALGCFDFFLRELIHYQNWMQQDNALKTRQPVVSKTVWMVLGYTLFFWSAFFLIRLRETNPDMLVAAFVYLSAGFLLRIRRGEATRGVFVLLGLALGLGYLTKQVMFPLAFVFLGVGLFLTGRPRKAAPGILVAFVAFILVSAPLVSTLSIEKSRLTFGDSGRFAYAGHVNNVPRRHWQGENPDNGTPVHPTRKIFDNPATFEFATPIGGTYPFGYDMTYWYEGLKTHLDLSLQIKVFRKNFNEVVSKMMGLNGSIVFGLMAILFANSIGWSVFKNLSKYAFLIVPPLCAIGLYCLVLVEGRYIGPFVAMVVMSVFFGASLWQQRGYCILVRAVTAVILAMFTINLLPGLYSSVSDLVDRRNPNLYWQVAEGLSELGLRPGDKVASISYSSLNNTRWARLARVRIIAEVYHNPYYDAEKNDFWKADSSAQQKILHAFKTVGARMAISDEEPRGASSSEWQRIGTTNYYVYFLS
jgi:hypothetical protein